MGETKPPEKNRIVNADFETDLAGWTAEGAVRRDTAAPLAGTGSLCIGPGKGAVRQRYAIGGLKVVYFGAMLKADAAQAGAQVRVQCFDARKRLVMDLKAPLKPNKEGKSEDYVALYFKTQARTTAMTLSIEKTTEDAGSLYADTVLLHDYDRDRKSHAPGVNLDQYMQPLWKAGTVYNETVLMVASGDEAAAGRLMFPPERILSVRDYSLSTTYVRDRDYTVAGNLLTRPANSRLPYVKDSDLPTGELAWPDLTGKHVVVTYTHREPWRGPIAVYQGARMPQTMKKLTRHIPLVVVATGDSITLGNGTSGFTQIPPYMPTWAELFAARLRKIYGYEDIRLYNTALGGMTSQWGADNASDAVAALEPDLVLIAFGMNDFWSLSGDAFRANITGLISRVKARRPTAEFVLISSMQFDPAYTADPQYHERMKSYTAALQSLTGEGVCLLDMATISGALYAAKKPKDFLSDPLHLNDFLARWYAQGLVALFDKTNGGASPR